MIRRKSPRVLTLTLGAKGSRPEFHIVSRSSELRRQALEPTRYAFSYKLGHLFRVCRQVVRVTRLPNTIYAISAATLSQRRYEQPEMIVRSYRMTSPVKSAIPSRKSSVVTGKGTFF